RRPWNTPAVPVDTEAHEVAGAQRCSVIGEALLRDVADAAVAAVHRFAEEIDGTGQQPLLAEDDLQQAGLARSVRAEYGDELAGVHIEVEPRPERAVAEAQRGVVHAEHGLEGCRDRHLVNSLSNLCAAHDPAFCSAVPTSSSVPLIQLR